MVEGRRTIYGEVIGIIMLDTHFPRIPGDAGNATTYDFPVRFKVVKGASIERVMHKADPTLLQPFIQAAQQLENEGVRAITTTCEFLAMFQEDIADAVSVPVFTSSLMLVPMVYRMLKKRQKVGVITGNSRLLTEKHLRGAGIDSSIPVVIAGLENEEEFCTSILRDGSTMHVEKVESEVVKVSKQLISKNPDIGAIVFSCGNLPPYASAVQEATGLPVFDISTLVNMVHDAVVRRRFTGFL